MPRRRRSGSYVAGDAGLNQAIQFFGQALQERRERPQREAREEEEFQYKKRQAGFQEILNLLSLGDKPAAAEAFARTLGRPAPTRDVTTRELGHQPVPGEDIEAQAFIPRIERTRTESALETPRERSERELATAEEREVRGERRQFTLGQEGAEAQEQRVRDRPPRTSDELGVSLFRKAAKGEPLTPGEQEFVTDFVRAQRKDPNFKQEFEGRITEKLSLGGEAALAPHERDYYLSNMQRRDPGAAARTEARAEEGLELQRERLGVTREGQQATGARAEKSQASNERNRVFDDLDRARQIIEKKHARRRETVPLGQNRQQALAQIDAAEDAELSQVTERHKKRYPKYSEDIEAQFGGGGSGRPAPRPSIMDLFKQGPTRQGTPRG